MGRKINPHSCPLFLVETGILEMLSFHDNLPEIGILAKESDQIGFFKSSQLSEFSFLKSD